MTRIIAAPPGLVHRILAADATLYRVRVHGTEEIAERPWSPDSRDEMIVDVSGKQLHRETHGELPAP